MDQDQFHTQLSKVVVLKQVRLAPDTANTRYRSGEEPLTEQVIDHVLPRTRPCAYCDQSCSGCMSHLRAQDKKTYRRSWVTQCDTCKKKVDLNTGQVIEAGSSGRGVYYVSRGLRIPKPGAKLGRPRKDFWNEPVKIFSDEEAREQESRRADLLDRLHAMRNK